MHIIIYMMVTAVENAARKTIQLGREEKGLSTIEYAMGTLAAAALAAVLYAVVNSSAVMDAIQGIITDALNNSPG